MQERRNRLLVTALALSMLSVGVQSAQAVDKTVDIQGDSLIYYGSWNDLREAIIDQTEPDTNLTINFNGDVIRRVTNDNITNISSNITALTITGNGNMFQGYESLGNATGPITVAANQEININSINQSYFTKFLKNAGTVNLTDSTFSDNASRTDKDPVDIAGGVLYNTGTASITDSTFENNSAYNGGAIANAGGNLYIEGSNFNNNSTSEGNGGAIDTWAGTATIVDSSFTGNHANNNFVSDDFMNDSPDNDEDNVSAGGAITNNNAGILNIAAVDNNVEFTDNYVGSTYTYTDDNGTPGWIFDDEEVTVDNRFSNAIANQGTINLNAGGEHSIIFNDTITYSGGVDGTININKSGVDLGGGVIAPTDGVIQFNNTVYNQTINFDGGTIKFGNYEGSAEFNRGAEGGFDVSDEHHVNFIVNNSNTLLDVIDGEAEGNFIGWVTLNSDLNLAIDAIGNSTDLFHTRNHVNSNGDYKAYFQKINLGGETKFEGTAGSETSSDWHYFDVKEDAELISTDTSLAQSNTMVSYNQNTGILKVGAYTLKDAVSDTAGDRTYRLVADEKVISDLGEMREGKLTILGNFDESAQGGHSIYGNGVNGITVGEGDELIIKEVADFTNFNSDNGGALNLTGGKTTVSDTTFSGNSATSNGGAINVSGGENTFTNTTFSRNDADNGGGIAISGGSLTLNNSTISENIAIVSGGGIYSTGGNLTLNNSTISDNFANEGSAIYNSGNVVLNNTSVTDNEGASSIYNAGTLTINAADGKTVSVNNKTTGGTAQGVIENEGTISLNAESGSTISVADKISGLAENAESNIVNVNPAENASGTVTLAGGVENSKLTQSAGTLTTGALTDAIVEASGAATTIQGVVAGSTVTAKADKTTISGAIQNASEITTSSTTTTISGAVSGGSTITTNAGTTTISGNVSGASEIYNSASTTITGTLTESAVISNNGTVSIKNALNSSTVTTSGGKTTISGKVSNGSQIFNTAENAETEITNSIDNSTVSTSAGKTTIASTGSIVNDSTVSTGGTGATEILGTVKGSLISTTETGQTTISGAVSDKSQINSYGGETLIGSSVSASIVNVSGGKTTVSSTGSIIDGTSVRVTGGEAIIEGSVSGSTVTTSESADGTKAGKTTISGEISDKSQILNTAANAQTIISGKVSGQGTTVTTSAGKTTITETGSLESGAVFVTEDGAAAQIDGAVKQSSIENYGTTLINGALSEGTLVRTNSGETTINGNITESSHIINEGSGNTTINGDVDDTWIEARGAGLTTLNGDVSGAETKIDIGYLHPAGNTEGGKVTVNSSSISAEVINFIDENSILNTSKDTTIKASITGNGQIIKTGDTTLTFSGGNETNNATGTEFKGLLKADAGTINLGYKLHADATIDLENAILNYSAGGRLHDDAFADIILRDGATANINGSDEFTEVKLDGKFWDMQGNGILNLKNTHYIIAGGLNPFTTGEDTINFYNAVISFDHPDASITDHNYGNITLNEKTTISLVDGHGGDVYNFDSIVSNDKNYLSVDVDLYLKDEEAEPVGDKLIVDSGSGELTLTELFITDDNGVLGGIDDEKTVQLIQNNSNENVLEIAEIENIDILSWATNVYKYGVVSESSGDTKSNGDLIIDSIKISQNGTSSTDTLRDLNRYPGQEEGRNNRGFSFLIDADGNNSYSIYRDLDRTNKGIFTIVGRTSTDEATGATSKSILSGVLAELRLDSDEFNSRVKYNDETGKYDYMSADGSTVEASIDRDNIRQEGTGENIEYIISVGAMGDSEDKRGSMFELTDTTGDTTFTISNVSIQDAMRYARENADGRIADGAAIYANSETAKIALKDTDFKNNTVEAGNGGAIANIESSEFVIQNGKFSDNTASGYGGAIYNEANMRLITRDNGNIVFSSNAAELGGAIYNAAGAELSMSGVIVEKGTETAKNDIYNAGTLSIGKAEIYTDISGDEGKTNVNGAMTIGEDITITQKSLSINNGGSLSAGTAQLEIGDKKITNDGTLTLTGGTNNNSIVKSDNKATSKLIISGEVTNAENVSITQDIMEVTAGTGIFTADISDITIKEEFNNNGSVTFTGEGENKSDITGAGALTITGAINNTASIAQNTITINQGASLTTDAGVEELEDYNDIIIDVTNGITNLGTLTFTGGINNNTVSGEGGKTVIDGEVENNAKISQAVSVTADSTLTSDVTNLGGTIANAGDVTLTGSGAIAGAISGTGDLTIEGAVNNSVSIEQSSLIIDENGSLTTTAGTDTTTIAITNGITNKGGLTFTGGKNENKITGAGDLTISGAVENTVSINQGSLTINGNGGALTTNAGTITTTGNKITNNGVLTFNAGTNKNAISGNGSTTFKGAGNMVNNAAISQDVTIDGNVDNKGAITGDVDIVSGIVKNNAAITGDVDITNGTVTNNKVITGDVSIADGSLDNNAKIDGSLDITGGSVDNGAEIAGDVTMSGGQFINNAQISGGLTMDGGSVDNNAAITGNVAINGGDVTSKAEHLATGENSIITNSGTLNLSGVLDKEIAGQTGTTNIDKELDFTDGAHIAGTLIMNGGVLDLQNGENLTTSHKIGKLTGTGEVKIDVDMSHTNPDTVSSDSLNVGSAEGAVINLETINITSDHDYNQNPDTYDSKVVQVINGNAAGDVQLNVGTEGSVTSTMTSKHFIYEFTEHDTIAGALNVGINKTTAGLKEFIQGEVKTSSGGNVNTYAMTRDEAAPPDIGTTFRDADDDKDSLVLNMNGHTLSGNNSAGITVDNGYVLDVEGQNAADNNGVIDGFKTAFAVNEGGKLSVSNATLSNNDTAFSNDGELNLSGITIDGKTTDVANEGTLNLSGANIIEGRITGKGTTNITGGVTGAINNIIQENITIALGAELKGSADNIKTANGIENAGTLTLNGGENKNVISGEGGKTVIADDVTNSALISQAIEVNTDKTLTSDVSKIDGTINNDGTIKLSGTAGEINNEISGNGNAEFSGTITNNAAISQNKITINSGSFTTDASNLTAGDKTVTNLGTLTLNGGENKNSITGEGGSVVIAGDVLNSALIGQSITVNAGDKLTSNVTNIGNTITNEGNILLNGEGSITNAISGSGSTELNGTITNNASITQSGLNNKGILTTAAGALDIENEIQNSGTIYFTGGSNSNTITGEGTLSFANGMTNSADVSQGTVVVGSTFTNTGSLKVTSTLNNTGTIANNGTLSLAGDNIANSGTINGSGTTGISGKVQNTGTISQNVEISETGELTSKADNIKNNILNNGTYNVTGGTIKNAITGSGDLILASNTTIASAISGNNINLNNGILSFDKGADIAGASLIANGGSITLQDGAISNTNLGNLILNSDLNLTLDGAFANHQLDTISAESFTNNGGHSINISNILLSSPTEDMTFSISPFGTGMSDSVHGALAGAVQYTGGEVVYSPIYRYSAKYDPDTALMNFNRVGGGGYSSYNPGVFAGAVAAQLGGYLTMLNSYDEAFRNMDMYMLMTQEQRQAMKLRNKYAASDSNLVYDPTINQYENKAGWFRPYATFEKVDLKGGPTVSNVAYGSFFGAESEMMDLGHGWDGIWGVYGGYNGSHQSYDGVGIYQNGGTLGVIGMAYKGNFFTGLTANVGANSGDASTMYGQDNFTLLMSGVASKSGYNFELAKGKFIIQPNFLMSYSFVNTFDYHSANGVSMNSDPLHAIQIEPGVKFIGNLKNGWQPYASVSMVWNIMDKTEFQANYVSLPELSIKPFVKYGVGVRKSWGERFTGFFQTYITNGGRNGVGLQLGLRWMLGKTPAKKGLNGPVPELKKTEIKVGRK